MKLTNRKVERERKIELSMTSMIDIVFLLLIFFMTTASFVHTERNLDAAIKVRQRAGTQAASDLEPAIVELAPTNAGFVYQLGGRDFTDQDELTEVLRQFDNKYEGAFVRVPDEAPFRMAAAAVQACKNAGFAPVSYVPKQQD